MADGYVAVPASVTAQPGSGCITFEGSDGTKTVTSADLRYRVAANSGTEDGTEPEPGTPVWQAFVDAVKESAASAEQSKTEAADSLQELKDGIASGDFKGEKGDKGDTGPIGPVGPQGAQGPQGEKGDTGPAVALDTTLTHEGEAADAKATGDEIAAYKALIAYGPDTVVQAGDGAGVKLEYQRDVNIAIKRIEDAVASMT